MQESKQVITRVVSLVKKKMAVNLLCVFSPLECSLSAAMMSYFIDPDKKIFVVKTMAIFCDKTLLLIV